MGSEEMLDLPKIRGREEEERLRAILAGTVKSSGGFASPSSLFFPTASGVTEVDALFVHDSGVYVFECKHMTGEVSGKLRDRMWTKTGDSRVLSFQNPVIQNRRHADAAALFFHISREQCISCVVFNDSCDISRVETGSEFITKTGSVKNILLPRLGKSVFSADELKEIIKKAEKLSASASKYADAHAATIREAKQRKKSEKKRRL